jgi:hypothetical protein
MANPAATTNVGLLPSRLLPIQLPIHFSPIVLDIGHILDVSATLPYMKTNQKAFYRIEDV